MRTEPNRSPMPRAAAIFPAVAGITGPSTTAIRHSPSASMRSTTGRRVAAWSASLASSQGALVTM